MTRRFLGLGIATLTAAALLVGVSISLAHADIQDDVCAEMANKLIGSQATLSQATNTRNTANDTLTTRRSELDAAVVAYVNAFGDLIVAKDGGDAGQVSLAQAAYDSAADVVAGRATAWGSAKIAQFDAQHDLDIAATVHLMNTTLNTKLACGVTP